MALWRVRATVEDKPGFLAVLAASLALRAVNILSVSVHVTEAGAVDDFLVDAPDDLTDEQLLAAVHRGRGRDAFVARAEAHSLVDAPTRALDLATYLAREPAAVGSALGELLDARASWRAGAADEPVGVVGTRMWVPAPGGGSWRLERPAPEFTPAEYARAQALLSVASALSLRTTEGDEADPVIAGSGAAATLLLPDGRELTLRHADQTDLPALLAMHARCSPASLRHRYLFGLDGPEQARLARLVRPAGGCTLLAVAPGPVTDRVVGMASLLAEGVQAQLSVLVEDGWQRRGIGTALTRRALRWATAAGLDAVEVTGRVGETALPRMLRRLGVEARAEPDENLVSYAVPLGQARERCASGRAGRRLDDPSPG